MDPLRPTPAGSWIAALDELKLGSYYYGPIALGEATQYRMLLMFTARGLVVGIDSKGFYEFQGFAHWSYVDEKLRIGGFETTASNIADLINALLEKSGIPSISQGRYDPHFCRERS